MREMSKPPKSRDDAIARMLEVASLLIDDRGIVGFRMSDVASSLGVAPKLPLYYFGTTAGLLGALAEHWFSHLASELRAARQSGPASLTRLERLVRVHCQFGLNRPLLYQAIHSAGLWSRAARSSSESDSATKAARWIDRAEGARNDAFAEYVLAVAEIQKAGHVRKQPADRVAHLVSALVDGFLFQVREEQVQANSPPEEQLEYLIALVRLAAAGFRLSAASTR